MESAVLHGRDVESFPCPLPEKPDMRGAVRVERLGDVLAGVALADQHHDEDTTGAQILNVMSEVARFLVDGDRVNQRALEPRPESVLGPIGVETMEP
jgi:hypothetical protein